MCIKPLVAVIRIRGRPRLPVHGRLHDSGRERFPMRPKAGHSMIVGRSGSPDREAPPWQSAHPARKGMGCQGLILNARRSVEYPRRDLKPSLGLQSVGRAPENHAIRLVDHRMDGYLTASPGVKPIQDFTPKGPVGVLKPRCTIVCDRIPRSATGLRCRRPYGRPHESTRSSIASRARPN